MCSSRGVQERLSRSDRGVDQTGVFRGGIEVRQVYKGQTGVFGGGIEVRQVCKGQTGVHCLKARQGCSEEG